MPVVHVTRPVPRIAVVELADRANSNLFTRELVHELFDAFRRLRETADVHVVVVHGYDSVFCAGGTQQELLGIVEGRVKFDDIPLYRLFLDCEAPVIWREKQGERPRNVGTGKKEPAARGTGHRIQLD